MVESTVGRNADACLMTPVLLQGFLMLTSF